ncbi:hypothetical protein M0657_004062 [Pyricularia oryzae]|nr:hypothetical protein M0657_004062 [Pyricularia oryzae]
MGCAHVSRHALYNAQRFLNKSANVFNHIRPYPLEYTGSRPLSPSQTSEGRTSTQVGDHWGILGVVCFWVSFLALNFSPFFGSRIFTIFVGIEGNAFNPQVVH